MTDGHVGQHLITQEVNITRSWRERYRELLGGRIVEVPITEYDPEPETQLSVSAQFADPICAEAAQEAIQRMLTMTWGGEPDTAFANRGDLLILRYTGNFPSGKDRETMAHHASALGIDVLFVLADDITVIDRSGMVVAVERDGDLQRWIE